MALFTESQADASTIVKMQKRVRGSDISWVVGVNDTDGNYYDMELSALGSDPAKSAIKTAVIAEMVKLVKQPAKVVQITTEVTDKGMGETLG
jgi:hypothetical protein